MQQVFRRQLLALGALRGDPHTVDDQCALFIKDVLSANVLLRPDAEDVLDVLQSNRVQPAVASRFVEQFNEAVWP